jgi:3',5'-nucleoside bisphosphate phosphatase
MLSDFHLHTMVSDGELTPEGLLREAAARGVARLSITDHDALGAYRWREGLAFVLAARLGLELTVGIEMDADLDGVEVHVLGFDVSLDDAHMNAHIARVREARVERARRELPLIEGLLGAGTVRESDIFAPGRETLMRPHFIHPILERTKRFSTYEEANAWYRENVKSGVSVPKPTIAEAVALIHGAGGWAVLAHPAYYERERGLQIVSRLAELRALGLDGVEMDYPYHKCSPHVFSADQELAYATQLRDAAQPLGLRATRGTDCHTTRDFDRVYGARAAS